MGITINKAAENDIPDLAVLLSILFSQERDFSPCREKQEKGLKEIVARCETGTIFVMREDNRVIGMVSLLYTVSTALGGKAALLEDMVLLPEKRGQGYGTQLLRTAVAYAKQEGCLRIQLLTDHDNAKAIRFYRRLNFRKSTMTVMRLLF